MIQGPRDQDEIDFDIVNQETGDLVGHLAFTIYTRYESIDGALVQYVQLQPWWRGGDFYLNPTSVPVMRFTDCRNFDQPTIIALHR